MAQIVPINEMSAEELRNIQTPIGKSEIKKKWYEERRQNWEKIKKDKVKCEICGKIYTRQNRTQHRKSQFCKKMDSINKKMLNILHGTPCEESYSNIMNNDTPVIVLGDELRKRLKEELSELSSSESDEDMSDEEGGTNSE
jgi:hypothetical protein